VRKLTQYCLFLLGGIILSPEIFSQSLQPTVIASDGGFATLPSGTISWTIGETITETFSSPTNYLTQGFQQPSLVLMNSVGTTGTGKALVYPNPATELITIDLNYLPSANYTIELFDLLGNKISSMSGENSAVFIFPLSDIANGVYMLTVSSPGFLQSYKVIKSK
jgi:hypothetical protein